MPFISLKIATARPLDQDTVDALHHGVTALMADVLHKDPALTSVLIETPAPRMWTIGAAPQPVLAHLDAHVTAGTNTAEDKAAFIAAATALLRRHLPDLPPATYVVVTEIAADSWGYGGLTQGARKAGAAA